MAELVEINNPNDGSSTYDQIAIEKGTLADGSNMALLATPNIDTSTATDLSTGYTSYLDGAGLPADYYRFRYKNSGSSAYSAYSDIFQAGTTIMHTRFRNRMRDRNSASYFFTNNDITDILANSIRKLFPHTYNEVIDESITTNSAVRKYSFPNGVHRVNDIEFLDANGDVAIFPRNWKLRAKQIIFDSPPPDGYTMRLYADKMFRKLAEVPDFLDDLILDLMQLEALQTFEMDRSKYYKYTTVVNPEGGNLPSITRAIERLTLTTSQRLNSLRRVRRPGVIKLV